MAVDLKDPFVQRAMLAGLGLAGVLYLFFGTSVLPMCYKPQAAKAREIRAEVDRVSADVVRAKQTAQGLTSLQTQYAELEESWARAQAMLPEKSEIPDFLTGVTKSALDCGLDVLMFEPKKAVRYEFYSESPVAMRVAGRYHQAGEFLARVANLSRLVNVERVQIRERTGSEDEGNTVEMELVLSAYTLEQGPPPSQAAAGSEASAGSTRSTKAH